MRRSLIVMAVLAGACALAFRLVTYAGFANDHFVHLSRAQAMLAGDLPLRDYTEEGVPLTVAISAGAQLLLGEGPFAELILVLISLSLAAAVTCYAAGRLTGSPMLGFLAALVQIAASPRLYSHPKILLYPVLFLVGWAYLRRPDGKRLVALGALTAIAFLLRHDHGVYCAVGAGTAVALAHWREGARSLMRRAAEFAAIGLLCVAPYLLYVQYERGLVEYFRVGLAISGGEANRADLKWPALLHIRSGPLVTVRPRPIESLAPIAVRWRAGLSDEDRRRHEQTLDLRFAEPRDEGKSWRYWIDPLARSTRRTLVHLPDAADTSGFDRASLRLEDEPPLVRRIAGTVGLDRLQPGPPLEDLFSKTNSTAIVFSFLWLMPAAALAVWVLWRRTCPLPLECGPAIPLLIVITMVTTLTLVREPAAYRVADGFGTAPILGAWLLAALYRAQPRSALLRGAMKIAVLLTAVLLASATGAIGEIGDRLSSAGVWGPSRDLVTRVRGVIKDTRTWPWRRAWPQGQGIALVPYLNRCTVDGDRLLVLWNAPEFNVFSRRPFAGGETLLVPVFRPPQTYEQSVLERLQRQRVPIVVADVAELRPFEDAYPHITEYLSKRYEQAGDVALPGGQRIRVFVDRDRRPSGIDPEFELPCFADRGTH